MAFASPPRDGFALIGGRSKDRLTTRRAANHLEPLAAAIVRSIAEHPKPRLRRWCSQIGWAFFLAFSRGIGFDGIKIS
jgi:hypothetical protein